MVDEGSKEKQFVTKVLYDNDNSVYGAEILLFDISGKVINKILITDENEFTAWTTFVEKMNEGYVPYTDNDINNLDRLMMLKAEGNENAYQSFLEELESEEGEYSWSSLKRVGSLETILKNEVRDNEYPVEINATTFKGMDTDAFSKVDHVHVEYAPSYHSTTTSQYGVGTSTKYGHNMCVNNLTTSSHEDGLCLSAYQGKVLKDNVDSIKSGYRWSPLTKLTDYLNYRVNPDLRLIQVYFDRPKFTGCKEAGLHRVFNSNTIPSQYAPRLRVVTPLYRGDVTVMFDNDGSVSIYNLNPIREINIWCQTMWHYNTKSSG